MKNIFNKSIEQLENDYWKDLDDYPTELVQRCYQYRKISIKTLTIEQIRKLISQNIGAKFLLTRIVDLLSENILIEGDLYQGDLLEATLKIDNSIWNEQPLIKMKYINLILTNEDNLRKEFKEKHVQRFIEKVN